jgi:hypothetical protein
LQIAATSLKQFEMAAYSSTPLARKLVIKAAATVVVVNGPANYSKLLGQAAHGLEFSGRLRCRLDSSM